jgi:hypothetical protein
MGIKPTESFVMADLLAHRNWMWENLILPRDEVKVLPATSVIEW